MRLLIFAVILSLAAIACSPTTSKCDPTNCATCCTSQGQCVLSVGAASCGSSGSLCATCIGGQSCSNGICTASQGAGGGSGAGGGGAAGGGSSDTATVVGTLGFAVRSSAWVNDPLAEANYLMLADTVANNCPERTSKRAPLAPDREALIFQLGAGNSLHSGTYVIDNAGGANQVSAFRVRYAAGIVTTVATANTGGSLTISNLTATSLSGTFSITLPAAGALTGSFALAAPCSTKGALGDDCFDDTGLHDRSSLRHVDLDVRRPEDERVQRAHPELHRRQVVCRGLRRVHDLRTAGHGRDRRLLPA